MLRQILVAVDFSVWSRSAAQHAFEVVRAIGGTVTLLHVLEDQESGPQNLEAAQALLRQLSQMARRPPTCLIVPASSGVDKQSPTANSLRDSGNRGDGVALTILAIADRLNAELIVIGLHGQGNFMAGALGQVIRQVLLEARVPVQVVPCHSNRPVLDRWSTVLADRATL